MYSLQRFNSGLRLLFIPIKNTQAITIEVLLPVGSRYESEKLNGASHFIEHMLFKGTPKRPNNLILSKELDRVGAQYNAFTGKDHTGYWIKIIKEKKKLAFDILSDMLFNSLIDQNEFQMEKSVIIEEIKMYQENPLYHIEDIFENSLYSNHPLGRLISGPIKTIRQMPRDDLMEFKNKFYHPSQMLVTISGNLTKKECQKLTKKYFTYSGDKNKSADYQKKIKKQQYSIFKPIKRKEHQVEVNYKKIDQVQLALGGLAYPYSNPKLEAASLLSIILGGNMSSRLFSEVRVKRGLAYFVKMGIGVYQDTGNYYVRAGIDKNKVQETLKAILKEFKDLASNGPTVEELKRAKEYFKGNFKLAMESSTYLSSWYSKQVLLAKSIVFPKEKIKKINQVTAKRIQQTAKELFFDQKLNLVLIGPFKQKQSFLRSLKREI